MKYLRIALLMLCTLLPGTVVLAQGTDPSPLDPTPDSRGDPSPGIASPPLRSDSVQIGISSISPNPCTFSTTITFALPVEGDASLVLNDPFGREVMRVAEGEMASGEHRVQLRTESLAEGSYMCVLRSADLVEVWPLVVMR